MKSIEQIEETADLDARLIHAAAHLEFALSKYHVEMPDASLGELVQESGEILGVATRDVNFAIGVRNSIAHVKGQREYDDDAKERASSYLIDAIRGVAKHTGESSNGTPSRESVLTNMAIGVALHLLDSGRPRWIRSRMMGRIMVAFVSSCLWIGACLIVSMTYELQIANSPVFLGSSTVLGGLLPFVALILVGVFSVTAANAFSRAEEDGEMEPSRARRVVASLFLFLLPLLTIIVYGLEVVAIYFQTVIDAADSI